MSENLSNLSGRKRLEKNLFEELGKAALNYGTPSPQDLERLADEFLFGKANTFGSVSFYDFMKPENKGKKAYVCNGTACLCSGKQDAVKDELKKHFKPEEIGHITCLGRCHENGAFHFDGRNYSAINADEIAAIIKNKKSQSDSYIVKAHGNPVLTTPFAGLDAHYSVLKAALKKDSSDILDEIKKSNIRGRGGAGFPMGIKLESCRNTKSETKFIICNADEGDPGAYSDRYLLEQRPHSVLLGMMLAGYAAQANYGVLYIRAEYPEAVNVIEIAIKELQDKNFIGKNIFGSGFNFEFKIIKAQGAYICGEETALINSIEGQRPEVRTRPPYPAQRGLFNKPTIVNNVETLASLPFIINNGGSAYNKLGTEKSSGTKLICLDSFFNAPGIYEVEMGTPLAFIVNELGGGFKEPVKAMQIGGPLGGVIPVSRIKDLTVDFESFAQNGFMLGHASIVCIPEKFPMIKYIEHLFEFAAYESCGKCFPCRLGTKRGYELVNKAGNTEYLIDRELFNDLLNTLQQGSLCAHGGGIPLPIKNILQYFESELKPYFSNQIV